jgi:putative transposase
MEVEKMLSLTYSYRIYPDAVQEARMLAWMDACRKVYNYALRERKDWIASRKCAINACSIRSEDIIPAELSYPDYYKQQNASDTSQEGKPRTQRCSISSTARRIEAT